MYTLWCRYNMSQKNSNFLKTMLRIRIILVSWSRIQAEKYQSKTKKAFFSQNPNQRLFKIFLFLNGSSSFDMKISEKKNKYNLKKTYFVLKKSVYLKGNGHWSWPGSGSFFFLGGSSNRIVWQLGNDRINFFYFLRDTLSVHQQKIRLCFCWNIK